MNLRDTRIIQDKYRNILQAVSQEVINLITGSSVTTPDISGMFMVVPENTMGSYNNDMD